MTRQGLTVACVYRSGGIYDASWVYALRRGLNRHAPDAHLRILTDRPAELPPTFDVVRLEHGWSGWWSKMELLRPGIFDGPTLYVDLDSLILGDLSVFSDLTAPVALLSDFYRPHLGQSGVLWFTPGEETERLWQEWTESPKIHMRRYRGDGEWLHAHAPNASRLQDLVPGAIASLKVHARQAPPADVHLVACHGRPKLDDPAAGWAHAAWCDLTRAAA